MSLFDQSFFISNRNRLRQSLKEPMPIVLTANGLLQRSADSTFPFRQDSSFWYVTGIDEPDILLVIGESEDSDYLIVPGRSTSREAFDGSIDSQKLAQRSGVQAVLDEQEGWQRLAKQLKPGKVATLASSSGYVASHGLYVNPARKRLMQSLKKQNPDLAFTDLRSAMMRLRAIKQPAEITAIQSAIDITISTLKSVKRSIAKSSYEYEIEAAITAGFRKKGAPHAYSPIVASGANACVLHYVVNNDSLTEGELVLLDVGAEVENYAADITRTYINGGASKRQEQVWQAVVEVQEYAKSLLKPGVLIGEYEKEIEVRMGEKLRELGLIKTIDTESVRKYYPHATSHFLGLDVHDAADYDQPLTADMVLTVEPGIYIPEEGIGIRIEDDIQITKNGNKVLSRRLPQALS